jgi:HEAT repeat protein
MLQIRIMECLRTAPDEKVMPVYLSLLNRDEELDSQIVSEIGARNYTDSLAVVHEAMKSENPSLKMQAILASGRMSHPDSLEHLLAILQEKDNANITATVIRMLGNFKSDKVLLTLLEGLSSPIGRIRANAIESLLSLNQTSTVNQIERLLQDDNNRVRANAALACLRFGRIQNLSVLADMARSNNKWMRLSCLWALSVTGMPEAREIMLGLLRDPDYDVLLSAVNFLKRIDAANR